MFSVEHNQQKTDVRSLNLCCAKYNQHAKHAKARGSRVYPRKILKNCMLSD